MSKKKKIQNGKDKLVRSINNNIRSSVRKLNPEYNKSQSYQRRKDRAEWNLIGLLGQIQIKKGEKVNSRWIKMKDISDAVELWYCR